MTKYAALLRGISPLNPNMRNEKLRRVFENLGFRNVRTVISSGNVLFESHMKSRKALESKIEKAIDEQLGFKSSTIIRSQGQFNRLIEKDPFEGKPDVPESRLNVTFLKRGGEVFSAIDTTSTGTPNVMLQIEKEHGKEITTRTWKTVGRIMNEFGKMNQKKG
ncbi:MAG TPA: DUF1697 domain-containing protein [Anaerolineales bacterium]|jgi:uncharacterized protein (DUF1697 family)|nr:DUF1697 domain-containing protein [Anaerolineales bacterium]